MNDRIEALKALATKEVWSENQYNGAPEHDGYELDADMFAELIVEDCRTVITELYQNTPLELCGPLLSADEEIMKHFYGVEE